MNNKYKLFFVNYYKMDKNKLLGILFITTSFLLLMGAGFFAYLVVFAPEPKINQYASTNNAYTQTFEVKAESSLQQPVSMQNDWLAYRDDSLGIKIDYPKEWETGNQRKETQYIGETIVSEVRLFTSPKKYDKDIHVGIVGVSTETVPKNIQNLDEYSDYSIDVSKVIFNNFKIIEQDTAALEGMPAYKIIFEFGEGQITFRAKVIYTIIGGKSYSVMYMALKEDYAKFLETGNKMIDSFEII